MVSFSGLSANVKAQIELVQPSKDRATVRVCGRWGGGNGLQRSIDTLESDWLTRVTICLDLDLFFLIMPYPALLGKLTSGGHMGILLIV